MARKPRVYVETSIVSYLTARPARDIVTAGRQQSTRDWCPPRETALSDGAAFDLQNRHRRSTRRVQVPGGVQGGQPGDRRAVLALRTPQLVELPEVEPELARGAEEALGGAAPCRQ